MNEALPPERVGGSEDDPIVAVTDPGEVNRAAHGPGDRAIINISNVFAWLFPLLMIAICAQVVLRMTGNNQAWLDDGQWWLYGAAVLIGVAYAVTTDSHVRVDIFYDGFAERKKRIYDIIGLVWLFLPFIILCWDVMLDYAITSIIIREGSSSPNGLHNLWLLKAFVNLSFLLIAAATWFAYVRCLARMVRPLWWRKLLFAFPSVVFAVNLAFYYAALGLVMLLAEPGTTAREAGRHPVFDSVALGFEQEMKITVMVALLATPVLIFLAWLLRDKSGEATA